MSDQKKDKDSRITGLFTRRDMLQRLASVCAGVFASPFLPAKEHSRQMVASIFYESYATVALQRALRYAGDEGFVASMPQLLHARTNAPYDNIIWNTWFTSYSEESVVTTRQGNLVVVAVHGGGIFALPGRIERSLRADMNRSNAQGLTGQYAAKISETEAHDVLDGKLPDGTEIPIYSFNEFKAGVADLPMRHGVVLDFATAKKFSSGYERFDVLKDDPNMIIRAGGVEPLAAYLDKAKDRNNTKLMGNWHPYDRIVPGQPQTRIPRLTGNQGGKGSDGKDLGLGWGYDSDYGISAGGLIGLARYVAVAPRDMATSLRYLEFES